MSEADVVRDVVALLQSYRVDATVIDAGGRHARGRLIAAAKTTGIEIGKLPHLKTGAGIPKGFADIEATLAPEGRSLYIEVKQPRRVMLWYIRYLQAAFKRRSGNQSADDGGKT